MEDNSADIGRLTAAIAECASARLYIARGKAYWNIGQRRKALNDYLAADALEPDGEAAQLIAITRDILDYRNLDLLNP